MIQKYNTMGQNEQREGKDPKKGERNRPMCSPTQESHKNTTWKGIIYMSKTQC